MSESPSSSIEVDSVALAANRKLLRGFSKFLLPAIAVVFIVLSLGVAGVLIGVGRMDSTNSTWPQILVIHLTQIAVGMLIGILCIFLGSAMSWFGITGTFSVAAEGGGAKLNVQGTAIGSILLIGGIILTALTLQKNVEGRRVITSIGSVQDYGPPPAVYPVLPLPPTLSSPPMPAPTSTRGSISPAPPSREIVDDLPDAPTSNPKKP